MKNLHNPNNDLPPVSLGTGTPERCEVCGGTHPKIYLQRALRERSTIDFYTFTYINPATGIMHVYVHDSMMTPRAFIRAVEGHLKKNDLCAARIERLCLTRGRQPLAFESKGDEDEAASAPAGWDL